MNGLPLPSLFSRELHNSNEECKVLWSILSPLTSRVRVSYVGLPSAKWRERSGAAVVIAQDKLPELTLDASVMWMVYLYPVCEVFRELHNSIEVGKGLWSILSPHAVLSVESAQELSRPVSHCESRRLLCQVSELRCKSYKRSKRRLSRSLWIITKVVPIVLTIMHRMTTGFWVHRFISSCPCGVHSLLQAVPYTTKI